MSWVTNAPTIDEMIERMSERQRDAARRENWVYSGLDYYGCNLSSVGCSCSTPTETSIAVRERLLQMDAATPGIE